MTEDQAAILKALGAAHSNDFGYLNFAGIARRSGVDKKQVRRNVRHLARRGLAQYGKGLWSEDGMPAGAGYCITKAGLEHLRKLKGKQDDDDKCQGNPGEQ